MPAKVLLLDDNPLFIEELRSSLKRKNYQLFVCTNSSNAIDTALLAKPSIFICDWQLQKDINGIVVTEILKCICPEIKVLFISGYNCFDLGEHLKNFSNLSFLEKPFSKSKLLEALEKLENSKPSEERHSTPVAIIELSADGYLLASNKLAQTVELSKIEPEKISSEEWQKVVLDKKCYYARIRKLGDKAFIFLIDILHEMLLKDPRFIYFLNGEPLNTPDITKDPCLPNDCMLIIDKHDAIRSLASEIMLENKVFCHTAISIEEGLKILDRDQSIGTIIVDSSFDQKTINSLIKSARRKNKNIRVIGACASSSPNLSEIRFDELLNKPFNAQALVDLFRRENSYVI